MSAHARRYSRIREWRGAKAAALHSPKHRLGSFAIVLRAMTTKLVADLNRAIS